MFELSFRHIYGMNYILHGPIQKSPIGPNKPFKLCRHQFRFLRRTPQPPNMPKVTNGFQFSPLSNSIFAITTSIKFAIDTFHLFKLFQKNHQQNSILRQSLVGLKMPKFATIFDFFFLQKISCHENPLHCIHLSPNQLSKTVSVVYLPILILRWSEQFAISIAFLRHGMPFFVLTTDWIASIVVQSTIVIGKCFQLTH